MKSFDGHTEYVNGVLIFSSYESKVYDFLKDAIYSGGAGAHFLFYGDLSFLKRRLLI
jgi:hypothetical protein